MLSVTFESIPTTDDLIHLEEVTPRVLNNYPADARINGIQITSAKYVRGCLGVGFR